MTATPQTNTTLRAIADALMAHEGFCICGHLRPDGDSLGSVLALAAALRKLGKRVHTLLADEEPPDARFAYLPGFDQLTYAGAFDEPFDVFVAVDVPTTERLADAAAVHARARLAVTIDHHAVEAPMAQLSFTDPDAASTTLLVWDLIGLLPVERDADMALCAFTGLVTDTGRFQHQNTDAAALEAAAAMVRAGADPSLVSREVYQQRSLASVRLEAVALAHMELLAAGAGAISWVSRDDMASCGAAKADAEPLIDALRNIAGVRVACMLREEEGVVRGSLRAKDGTDVAAVAHMFGGGGHRAAAGFTFEGTIEQARAALTACLAQLLGA